MKTTIICLFAIAGVSCLSNCVNVSRKEQPVTRTTTTEETSVTRTPTSTVQSQTTQSY